MPSGAAAEDTVGAAGALFATIAMREWGRDGRWPSRAFACATALPLLPGALQHHASGEDKGGRTRDSESQSCVESAHASRRAQRQDQYEQAAGGQQNLNRPEAPVVCYQPRFAAGET